MDGLPWVNSRESILWASAARRGSGRLLRIRGHGSLCGQSGDPVAEALMTGHCDSMGVASGKGRQHFRTPAHTGDSIEVQRLGASPRCRCCGEWQSEAIRKDSTKRSVRLGYDRRVQPDVPFFPKEAVESMSNKNLSGRGQPITQKGESATRNNDNGRVAIAIETILPKVPAGNAMPDAMPHPISERRKRFKQWWPTIVVGALAGAAVALSRGCWHGKKGWPIRAEGYSYQVCLTCGAMRLFDEKTFRGYGPFRYDLNELIEWEKSNRERLHLVASRKRTA